jgi:predicted N-acetyltransferase YhbS
MTKIRQEIPTDYSVVFKIIEEAFKEKEYSDHKEQFLVERLRDSLDFISELSLVAEIDGMVVGHILLTQIVISDGI